jgi:hypothetical protein
VQGERVESWDKGLQTLAARFWDGDADGACCADPSDAWIVNPASATYRSHLVGEIAASRSQVLPVDGVYIDFIKGNIGYDDRNQATGDVLDGYAALLGEIRATLQPQEELLFGGEGSSAALVEAGTGFGTLHIVPPGQLEQDPSAQFRPIAFAHPIGTYFLTDACRLAPTSEFPLPGWHQTQHAMSRLSSLIQGGLPTAAGLGLRAWASLSFRGDSRRALVQIAEEGLYWRLHGVRLVSDPDPLWSDPTTLRLFEIDGAVVARTKDWFVEKTVCDLYWWFGGRAPTQAELDDLAARTTCSFLGVFAATCEVREKFQLAPTPENLVQTREQARADILLVFPEYPAP